MTAGLPRENCENCGYAQKYSRQQPGEKPAFCRNHESWLCTGCREHMGCNAGDKPHRIEALPPRIDVSGIPPNDGIYANIPDDVYHADLGSLSSSGARQLLSTTPEEFDFGRRSPRTSKKVYDEGHAAHKMVLGKGAQLTMLDPAVHGIKADGKPAQQPSSTAMWKQAEAKARREGKIPIPRSVMERSQTMAGRVFQHHVAARLFGAGAAEHSIYWHDDDTGIRRRIRPDFLTEGLGRPICVDYKTSTSASPRQFQRAVFDYGYHMQQAYYEDGLAELGLEDIGFLFVVQSKTAPYTVSVCQIEPAVVELGRRQNRQAIELFARCTESGRWPGYDGIHTVGMAGWAVKQIEETFE